VLAAGPADGAVSAPKKTVKVGDNFFSPKKLSVKAGTTVTWKWNSDNADTHDVKLKKGPKGVKKFHSDSAATDFSYKKKLSKKGTYSLLCTFHEGMTQKITVK
jgi:plastocyanin